MAKEMLDLKSSINVLSGINCSKKKKKRRKVKTASEDMQKF